MRYRPLRTVPIVLLSFLPSDGASLASRQPATMPTRSRRRWPTTCSPTRRRWREPQPAAVATERRPSTPPPAGQPKSALPTGYSAKRRSGPTCRQRSSRLQPQDNMAQPPVLLEQVGQFRLAGGRPVNAHGPQDLCPQALRAGGPYRPWGPPSHRSAVAIKLVGKEPASWLDTGRPPGQGENEWDQVRWVIRRRADSEGELVTSQQRGRVHLEGRQRAAGQFQLVDRCPKRGATDKDRDDKPGVAIAREFCSWLQPSPAGRIGNNRVATH